MRGVPPERALWRELLDLALGKRDTFQHGDRPLSAAVVWAVGAAIYFRSNDAGVVGDEDFGKKTNAVRLAGDCRHGERSVRAALDVLCELGIVRKKRRGRREPLLWLMNLGGMDWPAVRRRVERDRAQGVLPLDASTVTMTTLSPVTMTTPKGYREDQRDPLHGVAATTTDRNQQQQRRLDGQIGYIAPTYRKLREKYRRAGRPVPPQWDEGAVRADFAGKSSEERRQMLDDLQEFIALLRAGIIPGAVAPSVRESRPMTDTPPPDLFDRLREFPFADDEIGAAALAADAVHVVADGLPLPVADLPEPMVQVGVNDAGEIGWVSLPESRAS